jgi:hypothetical protein
MVANGDADKRVAILEFGWTSDPRPTSPYSWHAVTEQEKADYLARAFDFARKNWQPWIGAMNVIYMCDPHWTKDDEQYYWAITNPDGTTRPAYQALRSMTKDAAPPPAPGAVATAAAEKPLPTPPAAAAPAASPAASPAAQSTAPAAATAPSAAKPTAAATTAASTSATTAPTKPSTQPTTPAKAPAKP